MKGIVLVGGSGTRLYPIAGGGSVEKVLKRDNLQETQVVEDVKDFISNFEHE